VCEWCGGVRVGIANWIIVPCDLAEAKRHWKNCVVSQSGSWGYCAAWGKGRIGDEPMEMLSMKRRAGLA
jgi:hypothetical protein